MPKSQGKICILDDNPSDAALIMDALRCSGYSGDFIYFEGLRDFKLYFKSSKEKISLILLDVVLDGGLTGFDVFEKIKQIESLRLTPIVMLTGSLLTLDKLRAAEIGVSGYFIKPFEQVDLRSMMRCIYEYWCVYQNWEKHGQ